MTDSATAQGATTHIAWSKGGDAIVTTLDGDRVSVLSSTPSAPGSRPDGALVTSGAGLRIKVARCRREGERFLIEGRLIDATRDTRAEIQRLLDPAT
jgi:hypothetical protein